MFTFKSVMRILRSVTRKLKRDEKHENNVTYMIELSSQNDEDKHRIKTNTKCTSVSLI